EEEFFQQLLIAAHGNARTHQRIHFLALDIPRPYAVDAPAPVENPHAAFHQIDRGCDVGGDAGVRVALDDHLVAGADWFHGAEDPTVGRIFVACGENASDGGAMPRWRFRIPGVDAGARLARVAVVDIGGELGRIEIDVALDNAYPHRMGLYRRLFGRQPLLVVVHGIQKAIGDPFAVARLVFRIALYGRFSARLLGHDRVHTHYIGLAQQQGVTLGKVLLRQAQLVGIQGRDHAVHLGVVLFCQASRLFEAVVLLFDDQADQI